MRWERVELHCHTKASDGNMDANTLVKRALERGYKAITVSDHNTISAIKKVQEAAKDTSLVVIPGIEWTTFWGHIVVTGGNSTIDWTDITYDNINECIKKAQDEGDIVTLAHPKRLGTPFGSECRILYRLDDIKIANAYEVWTHYNPNTQLGVELSKKEWLKLIKTTKIAPVYGYDWHNEDVDGPTFAYTYVAIDGEINSKKVIDAIKNSHTYISAGVEVECTLSKEGKTYIPGDEIAAGKYKLDLSFEYIKEYQEKYLCQVEKVNIYKDDCLYKSLSIDKNSSLDVDVDAKRLLRVELVGNMNGTKADITLLSPYYIKK